MARPPPRVPPPALAQEDNVRGRERERQPLGRLAAAALDQLFFESTAIISQTGHNTIKII